MLNNLKNYASNFSSSFESEKNIINSFHSYFNFKESNKSNNGNDSFLKKRRKQEGGELTIDTSLLDLDEIKLAT